MTEIRLSRFSSSPVLAVAGRLGILADYDLELTETIVGSSREQFADLAAGKYDVVLTSPDNVLRHLGTNPGLRMLRGVDHGLGLSLMSMPGLDTVSDLAGHRIGVDAPDSGFALVFYEILSAAALGAGSVTLVELGTTPMRTRALAADQCAATMLNAGHDVLAERAGANRLVRASQLLGPYLGSVLATAVPAATESASGITDFLRAWDEAVAAAMSPANEELVIAEITTALRCEVEAATEFYATLLDPTEGLIPDGAVEGEPLETVRRLRATYFG